VISVVIPVFNHADFLAAAVLSALRSRMVSEILLVDDGSSDQSPAVIASLAALHPRVRDLTEPQGGNRGAHQRLNQLVTSARNEWVAVLNSDDAFAPARFESVVPAMRRGAADFFFGDIIIVDDAGKAIGQKRGYLDPEYPFPTAVDEEVRDWRPLLFCQNFVATTSNLVFTKSLHTKVGGFAPRRYCHDWEFILRSAVLGRGTYVPQYFTCYRVHGANTISEAKQDVVSEVREMFEDVLGDFPDVQNDPEIRVNLAANRYLH
jgi:glycosyltransferase involved in cell wall biosynthesis